MAPEQVQGLDVARAADVYSLGLVLLELLTGRKAFAGSPTETAVARLTRNPDTETKVPEAWRALLREMTGRTAASRPRAAEVHDRLQAMLLNPEVGTAPLAVAPVNADAPGSLANTATAPSQTTLAPEGTAVMPASLTPNAAADQRRRRVAALAIIAVLAILIGVAALAADGGESPATTVPTSQPVVTTSTATTTPPTTEAPAATQPEPKEKGSANGKGNGNGNGNGANDN